MILHDIPFCITMMAFYDVGTLSASLVLFMEPPGTDRCIKGQQCGGFVVSFLVTCTIYWTNSRTVGDLSMTLMWHYFITQRDLYLVTCTWRHAYLATLSLTSVNIIVSTELKGHYNHVYVQSFVRHFLRIAHVVAFQPHRHFHKILVWLFYLRIGTVKPVCNDHLCNKIYYLWFIQ